MITNSVLTFHQCGHAVNIHLENGHITQFGINLPRMAYAERHLPNRATALAHIKARIDSQISCQEKDSTLNFILQQGYGNDPDELKIIAGFLFASLKSCLPNRPMGTSVALYASTDRPEFALYHLTDVADKYGFIRFIHGLQRINDEHSSQMRTETNQLSLV